jgi:hypothetical protein
MDKYRVTLTAEERAELEHLVSVGTGAARRLTHARILLLADTAADHGQALLAGGVGLISATSGLARRALG